MSLTKPTLIKLDQSINAFGHAYTFHIFYLMSTWSIVFQYLPFFL